MKCKTLKSV